MKELATLYQIIYDDLKDSQMLIEYAKELKDSNKQLADTYVTDAKNRLAHSLNRCINSLHLSFKQWERVEKRKRWQIVYGQRPINTMWNGLKVQKAV